MTKLTPMLKRKITKDWQTCFPSLSIYKPMQLLKRLGPVLVGICLDRDSMNEGYFPTFHIHFLTQESSGIYLILAQRLYYIAESGWKAKIEISVLEHDNIFREAAKTFREQSPLPFEDEIRLMDLNKAYLEFDDYQNPIHGIPSLAFVSTYYNELESARQIMHHGYELLRQMGDIWLQKAFKTSKYEGLDQWLSINLGKANDQSLIRNIVESEIERHKLHKITFTDLLV